MGDNRIGMIQYVGYKETEVTKPTKSVPQSLTELGDLYRQRNELYGDNYLFFGKMMTGMFPAGISLKTEDDYNRFALIIHIATKLTRIAQTFPTGGHPDSCDDIAVYAQMLKEVEAIIAERKTNNG